MSRNPKFDKSLGMMKAMHDKKNEDYSNGGPYDNFELVATMTGLDIDDVFLVQICNKIARLKSIRQNERDGVPPNFESKEDTRLDLAVYSTMYLSYFLQEPQYE